MPPPPACRERRSYAFKEVVREGEKNEPAKESEHEKGVFGSRPYREGYHLSVHWDTL
jgi:hypothetical protein